MSDIVELEQHPVKQASGLYDATTRVAASWYVAMRSTDLKKKPVALTMFGQPLVAWRDASGRPVLMERYCTHLGASLADGQVVDGCIQCPFHNWRYDSTGTCVHVPGHSAQVPALEPIPRTACQSTYATSERYGYIWAWYGSEAPLHPLPELPAADDGRDDFIRVRFAFDTSTSVLRIVENFYDAQHAAPVHGLPISAFELTLLDDSRQAQDVEALAQSNAWFGAAIEFRVSRYFGLMGILSSALGLDMEKMNLHFDGYPGGCIMTVRINDELKYKLLQCVTPVNEDKTVVHMLIAMKKASKLRQNALNYVLYGLQTKMAARHDVAIWNSMKPDGGGAYSKYDKLVLKYRAFYHSWVDKVAHAQS